MFVLNVNYITIMELARELAAQMMIRFVSHSHSHSNHNHSVQRRHNNNSRSVPFTYSSSKRHQPSTSAEPFTAIIGDAAAATGQQRSLVVEWRGVRREEESILCTT